MSAPHCPTCAAFDRWAEVWANRRGGAVGPLGGRAGGWPAEDVDVHDQHEVVAYAYAKLVVYHRGATRPAVLLAARSAACQDFREKLLDDASARMAALTIEMPLAPEEIRLRDGTLGVCALARYLLVEGAFNGLALHLLAAEAPLPRP